VAVLVPLSCARRVAIIESFSRSMTVRAALVAVRVDRRYLSAVSAIANSDCVIRAMLYTLLAPWLPPACAVIYS
jgi:hypothetical protein